MDWTAYGSFLVFAVVLILIPGPDFAVVTRSTLVGGRRRGQWSAFGVFMSNTLQAAAAAAGLGVIIVRIEPLFLAVKWAGIAYLCVLGAQAFRSAWRGQYPDLDVADSVDAPGPGTTTGRHAWRGFRPGFLSNITNPKVLIFYLAVLPQFLGPHAPIGVLVLFAATHAVLGLAYLFVLVLGLHRARLYLARRRVRRMLDAATGTALLGFSARLAAEQA